MIQLPSPTQIAWQESVTKTEDVTIIDIGEIGIYPEQDVITYQLLLKDSNGVIRERRNYSRNLTPGQFDELMARNPVLAKTLRALAIALGQQAGVIPPGVVVDQLFNQVEALPIWINPLEG